MKSRDVQILNRLSESVTAGAPLAVGLRAAAEEAGKTALARSLTTIATQLENGDSVEAAVGSQMSRRNAHLAAAIAAGVAEGRLAQVLSELVRYQQFQHRLRRSLWISLMYPMLLLVLLASAIAMVFVTVVPPFRAMFADFGVSLPLTTEILLGFYDVDWRSSLIGLSMIPMFAVLLRILLGKPNWRLLLCTMPFFGQIFHWSGVAQFANLLRVFLQQQTPLVEALEWTSLGVRDANIARAARQAAEDLHSGRTFRTIVEANHRLPKTASVLLAWGEEHDRLPESLEMLADFAEGHLVRRIHWLTVVIPPLALILIATAAAFVFLALFLPLVSLTRTMF